MLHDQVLSLISTPVVALKRAVAVAEVDGIRELLEGTGALFAWSPKFELPRGVGFRHPLLSRLAFVTRYDVVLRYLDRRTRRSAPEPERLAAADSLRLAYLDGDEFRLDPMHEEIEIPTGSFAN